jgi:hypothetical protein
MRILGGPLRLHNSKWCAPKLSSSR